MYLLVYDIQVNLEQKLHSHHLHFFQLLQGIFLLSSFITFFVLDFSDLGHIITIKSKVL